MTEPVVEKEPLVTPAVAAQEAPAGVLAGQKAGEPVVGESNEAFFGVLLIGCLALCLFAATGYFGLAGYRYFKQFQAEQAIPSIESLPRAETSVRAEAGQSEKGEAAVAPAAVEKSVAAVDKKTLAVKVLNGGAAKGVAGTYAEKLKQAGFTKTTIGNAFGDYTGQTLYSAKGQEASAEVIKAEVLKTYPKLVVQEAPAGDKDAAAATFVLILGR